MGQTLGKCLTEGNQTRQDRVKKIVDEEYSPLFADQKTKDSFAAFYRSVTELVQQINKKFGYKNQIKVPTEGRLRGMFERYHVSEDNPLRIEEFEDVLRKLMIEDAGFMKLFGSLELLVFIFGVPITAWLLKKVALRNYGTFDIYFIPTVTSLTAFILARLNKV